MQVRWALVGSQSEVVLVCMSVHNGFTIEIYGFTHSLCTFLARATHDAIVMEIEVENSEDRRRRQNESRDMKDSELLNKRMKDDKITVTGDDLPVSTRAIYFTR